MQIFQDSFCFSLRASWNTQVVSWPPSAYSTKSAIASGVAAPQVLQDADVVYTKSQPSWSHMSIASNGPQPVKMDWPHDAGGPVAGEFVSGVQGLGGWGGVLGSSAWTCPR